MARDAMLLRALCLAACWALVSCSVDPLPASNALTLAVARVRGDDATSTTTAVAAPPPPAPPPGYCMANSTTHFALPFGYGYSLSCPAGSAIDAVLSAGAVAPSGAPCGDEAPAVRADCLGVTPFCFAFHAAYTEPLSEECVAAAFNLTFAVSATCAPVVPSPPPPAITTAVATADDAGWRFVGDVFSAPTSFLTSAVARSSPKMGAASVWGGCAVSPAVAGCVGVFLGAAASACARKWRRASRRRGARCGGDAPHTKGDDACALQSVPEEDV